MYKKVSQYLFHGGFFLKSLVLGFMISCSNLAWSDQQRDIIYKPFEQDRVIVVLRSSLGSIENGTSVDKLIQQYVDPEKDSIHYTYHRVLNGFAGTLSTDVIEKLKSDPRVDRVEVDSDKASLQGDFIEQEAPSWNLDRIDQTDNLLDSTYHYKKDGTGVHAYILDTGIRSSHEDFGGRVVDGVSFVEDDTSAEDCRGHGTRVAGILGSKTYGVAKNVTMHSVRIFDCDGKTRTSAIIAGMEWILDNHQKPAIVNMSFSVVPRTEYDVALKNLIDAGITIVTGAGNTAEDVCDNAPANYPDVITVASTDAFDQRRTTSGYGPCVDVFAPGENITTTEFSSDTASSVRNGSSFASPSAAGVAALFLQDNPDASPAEVTEHILSNAIEGIVGDAGEGSPNLFLYSPYGSVVQFRKRNATGYALDGGNNGDKGQNVYLWSQNANNVNQQWIEIDQGDGFYSYQKRYTNYCLDGGNGGANKQNVYLWSCSSVNQNQHWKKETVGPEAFRLLKRNALGFALDGGNGGSRSQNVNLYDSSHSSENLHWNIVE